MELGTNDVFVVDNKCSHDTRVLHGTTHEYFMRDLILTLTLFAPLRFFVLLAGSAKKRGRKKRRSS